VVDARFGDCHSQPTVKPEAPTDPDEQRLLAKAVEVSGLEASAMEAHQEADRRDALAATARAEFRQMALQFGLSRHEQSATTEPKPAKPERKAPRLTAAQIAALKRRAKPEAKPIVERPKTPSVAHKVHVIFEAHPDRIMTAADVLATGIDAEDGPVRQALGRLTDRKILVSVGKGLGWYYLAPSQGGLVGPIEIERKRMEDARSAAE
jgi:hypothetical protein